MNHSWDQGECNNTHSNNEEVRGVHAICRSREDLVMCLPPGATESNTTSTPLDGTKRIPLPALDLVHHRLLVLQRWLRRCDGPRHSWTSGREHDASTAPASPLTTCLFEDQDKDKDLVQETG